MSGMDIGILIDEAAENQQHRLCRTETITGYHSSLISLQQLLSRSTTRFPDEGFLRGDRIEIAVALGFNVIQLEGTAWWNKQWSTANIILVPKSGSQTDLEFSDLAYRGKHVAIIRPPYSKNNI